MSGCADPNPQLKNETNEKSTKGGNNHNENNNKCYKEEIRNRRWNVRRIMRSTKKYGKMKENERPENGKESWEEDGRESEK